MDFWTGDLNYLAVVVTATIPIALGTWWYMPRVGLGDVWMRLIATTREELDSRGGRAMAIAFISTIIGAFVLSYVLALLTRFAGADGFLDGLVLGLWIWVGVIATTSLGVYVFAGSGLRLWVFNNAYQLVSVPLMTCLLAAWK